MNHKEAVFPLMVIVVLLAVTSCFAARTDAGKSYSLRIGAFMPAHGLVSDAVGSSMLDVRLGYDLKNTARYKSTVEAGWFGSSDNDNNFRVLPVDYTYSVKIPSRIFYGAGAGLYFASINEVSKTLVGLHVLGGWSMSDTMGLEARYTNIAGDLDGQNISGWSVFLTGKF